MAGQGGVRVERSAGRVLQSGHEVVRDGELLLQVTGGHLEEDMLVTVHTRA